MANAHPPPSLLADPPGNCRKSISARQRRWEKGGDGVIGLRRGRVRRGRAPARRSWAMDRETRRRWRVRTRRTRHKGPGRRQEAAGAADPRSETVLAFLLKRVPARPRERAIEELEAMGLRRLPPTSMSRTSRDAARKCPARRGAAYRRQSSEAAGPCCCSTD